MLIYGDSCVHYKCASMRTVHEIPTTTKQPVYQSSRSRSGERAPTAPVTLPPPPPPPPPLRIKQPEYQCYRERIGVARSIAVMEDISAELKALLLVGLVNECHGSALAFSVLSYRG